MGCFIEQVSIIGAGIRQRSVTRSRQRHEAYTVWEPRFRNGLCRTGQYFVGRPANRPVTEHYEQPVYDVQPQHIKVKLVAGLASLLMHYSCLVSVRSSLCCHRTLSTARVRSAASAHQGKAAFSLHNSSSRQQMLSGME